MYHLRSYSFSMEWCLRLHGEHKTCVISVSQKQIIESEVLYYGKR